MSVVEEGQVFTQAAPDYLIAIGGGSPQDTCKAIGTLSVTIRNLPMCAVWKGISPTRKQRADYGDPTAAGTAAEVTI
ncbi:iron-containing alcohol dehydrogenase [Salmonella enterica subsp. enterica]|nr:iron-containing alcohol dehydrogenase [Salmonella enterica subsp. enterica]